MHNPDRDTGFAGTIVFDLPETVTADVLGEGRIKLTGESGAWIAGPASPVRP